MRKTSQNWKRSSPSRYRSTRFANDTNFDAMEHNVAYHITENRVMKYPSTPWNATPACVPTPDYLLQENPKFTVC